MSVAAVILAAGFGTRLAPVTNATPKPLLMVGDRPVATRLLDRIAELPELDQVVVVVNDRHIDQWHAWRAALPEHPRIDIVNNGVLDQDQRPGAVTDLALAVANVARAGPGVGASAGTAVEWILVLAGDNLIDEPLLPHVVAAQDQVCPIVLCRDLGSNVPPGRFGEITVDEDDVVIRFREKPAEPDSPLVATCSYVLAASTSANDLERYLETGDPDSPGGFIGWLASQRPVRARPLTGRYFDIGNHETLALARAAYRG